MTERPILFSAPMVRAILGGRKTQTRRACKGARDLSCAMDWPLDSCPYGRPGDRLWVRETWQYFGFSDEGEPCISYLADHGREWPWVPQDQADKVQSIWEGLSHPKNFDINDRACDNRWRPSIHMPRWASRITLEVTDVRVERLDTLSRADAAAEGICYPDSETKPAWYRGSNWPEENFARLWDAINGAGAWAANPWVWVIKFRRVP